MSKAKNRRVVLRSRPPGLPTLDNFGWVEETIPEPGPGEVLLRTLWLSIEPYMLLGMKGAAPHSPKRGLDASSHSCQPVLRRCSARRHHVWADHFGGCHIPQ